MLRARSCHLNHLTAADWRLAADTVLTVHVGVAAFLVLGQLMIMIGGLARLHWVREPRFRIAHMALIVVIAAETMVGAVCPLTTLEQTLRVYAGEPSYVETFTEHWLTPLLFFEAPHWVFAAIHGVAALVIIGTWFVVPPDWRRTAAIRDGDPHAAEA